jgi:hypothetical protein
VRLITIITSPGTIRYTPRELPPFKLYTILTLLI